MIVFLDKSVVYIYTHLLIVDMYAVKRYHYGVLLFYLILIQRETIFCLLCVYLSIFVLLNPHNVFNLELLRNVHDL